MPNLCLNYTKILRIQYSNKKTLRFCSLHFIDTVNDYFKQTVK